MRSVGETRCVQVSLCSRSSADPLLLSDSSLADRPLGASLRAHGGNHAPARCHEDQGDGTMPETFGKRQRKDVKARKAAAAEERRLARAPD